MTLKAADILKEYIIEEVNINDTETENFLFTLGCYSGERITVVSKVFGGLIVAIKDGRYNIDNQLAEAISVR